MGMYGEWLRVTGAELKRAGQDLSWAQDRADELDKHESTTNVAERRRMGTDKTWHALDYLLTRKGFPVQIIYGEEPFESEDDWGYGPPRYITADRVREASAALAHLSEADLLEGVQQSDLLVADIYPSVWDRPDELAWAVCHLPHVKTYFEAAAKAGDAVICWIG